MIKFSGVSQKNFDGLSFVVQGDGAATVLKMDLGLSPLNVSLTGVLPSADVTCQTPGFTALGTIATVVTSNILTITFSPAPKQTETLGVNVAFSYNSLP